MFWIQTEWSLCATKQKAWEVFWKCEAVSELFEDQVRYRYDVVRAI